uniref:Uncharacterized protein n=2 Tax=Meloidogyne TaxID=189290 RepID=A0A6V7WCJ6_MELEN|nr:unnamed protein product [Meloidogyne enterolobii]CAD2184715.1 unnamed protein product [Meloidogyne enterolobii]CAD2202403.1 unnamed protein product [Meloidogyne enterolobii]
MTSFYIILPSNTNVDGNRTNSFRVRLPRKLQFNSEWYVGLTVMVYPHSWPSIGTSTDQFVTVTWQSGEVVRVAVPSGNLTNPQQLKESLDRSLSEGCETFAENLRVTEMEYKKQLKELKTKSKEVYNRQKGEKRIELNATEIQEEHLKSENEIYEGLLSDFNSSLDENTKKLLSETGFEPWLQVYRKPGIACAFDFHSYKNRFSLFVGRKYVKKVEITEQLAYILGFDKTVLNESTIAKFMPDMSGGVSSFHVYAPGLIEPMVIGDVTAPVLRIVTIRGKQDEIIEEQFLSVQYHKLLVKEIAEILIEIRTAGGVLMPFQYGTCTLTLHFKKSAYF